MSLYAELYEIADRVVHPNFELEDDYSQGPVKRLADSLYAICLAYGDTIEEWEEFDV